MSPQLLIMYTMGIEKKKFKKLMLLCRAFELDKEVFEEIDQEYGLQFSKDFQKENEYLISLLDQQEDVVSEEPSESTAHEIEEERCPPDDVTKKLHRALARVTHPDLHGDEEEFKLIQEAYEKNDIVTLLLELARRNLDCDFTNIELSELEKKLDLQKINLEERKKSLRWAWAESKKDEKFRDLIRQNLGVNPEKFKSWMLDEAEKAGL